jgi:hypothetical protein
MQISDAALLLISSMEFYVLIDLIGLVAGTAVVSGLQAVSRPAHKPVHG